MVTRPSDRAAVVVPERGGDESSSLIVPTDGETQNCSSADRRWRIRPDCRGHGTESKTPGRGRFDPDRWAGRPKRRSHRFFSFAARGTRTDRSFVIRLHFSCSSMNVRGNTTEFNLIVRVNLNGFFSNYFLGTPFYPKHIFPGDWDVRYMSLIPTWNFM